MANILPGKRYQRYQTCFVTDESNRHKNYCINACGIISSLKSGRGRVVRFSAHAWRACFPKGNAGSNPALSAQNANTVVSKRYSGIFLCHKHRQLAYQLIQLVLCPSYVSPTLENAHPCSLTYPCSHGMLNTIGKQ